MQHTLSMAPPKPGQTDQAGEQVSGLSGPFMHMPFCAARRSTFMHGSLTCVFLSVPVPMLLDVSLFGGFLE